MKKVLLFLFFIPQFIFAQAITREYLLNDSLFRPKGFTALCKLSNGDLLATADVWDTVPWYNNNSRVSIIRMDSIGNIIWSKILPQTHNTSRDASADSTGCYLLNGQNYCSIVRCDTAINPTWMRHITNGPSGYLTSGWICRPAPHGGCYVAGVHSSITQGDNLLWVMKFDSAGNTIFSNNYGCTGYELELNSTTLEIMNDGGIVLPFWLDKLDSSFNHYYGCGLMRLDSSGTIVWMHAFSDSLMRIPYAMKMLPDSGFVIAGSIGVTPPAPYVFMIRTDKFGNEIWSNYYDQLCETRIPINRQGLTLTDKGNLLMGFTNWQLGNFCTAGELMECDTSGQFIRALRIGGMFTDSIMITKVIASGGKIIANGGHITNVNNTDNVFPIMHPLSLVFDSLPNTFCDKTVPAVFTYPAPVQTDHPAMTVTPGPTAFFMTLLTLQNFQFDTSICVPNGIENPDFENGNVTVYPNPSSGNMVMNVHLPSANSCQFLLYDFTGRLLQTNTIQNNTSFTLERKDRADGIYFIQLIANGEQVYTGKIVFTN